LLKNFNIIFTKKQLRQWDLKEQLESVDYFINLQIYYSVHSPYIIAENGTFTYGQVVKSEKMLNITHLSKSKKGIAKCK
jgi:hypothetical protein